MYTKCQPTPSACKALINWSANCARMTHTHSECGAHEASEAVAAVGEGFVRDSWGLLASVGSHCLCLWVLSSVGPAYPNILRSEKHPGFSAVNLGRCKKHGFTAVLQAAMEKGPRNSPSLPQSYPKSVKTVWLTWGVYRGVGSPVFALGLGSSNLLRDDR